MVTQPSTLRASACFARLTNMSLLLRTLWLGTLWLGAVLLSLLAPTSVASETTQPTAPSPQSPHAHAPFAVSRDIEMGLLQLAGQTEHAATQFLLNNHAALYASPYLRYSLVEAQSISGNALSPLADWSFAQNRKFMMYHQRNELFNALPTLPLIVNGVQLGDYFQVVRNIDSSDSAAILMSVSTQVQGQQIINSPRDCGLAVILNIKSLNDESKPSANLSECLTKGKSSRTLLTRALAYTPNEQQTELSLAYRLGNFQFIAPSKGLVTIEELAYWQLSNNDAAKAQLVGNLIVLGTIDGSRPQALLSIDSVQRATLYYSLSHTQPLTWQYDQSSQSLMFTSGDNALAEQSKSALITNAASQHAESTSSQSHLQSHAQSHPPLQTNSESAAASSTTSTSTATTAINQGNGIKFSLTNLDITHDARFFAQPIRYADVSGLYINEQAAHFLPTSTLDQSTAAQAQLQLKQPSQLNNELEQRAIAYNEQHAIVAILPATANRPQQWLLIGQQQLQFIDAAINPAPDKP